MPQDRPYIVRFPDGSTKTYPAGMDQQAMAQDVLAEMPKRGGDKFDPIREFGANTDALLPRGAQFGDRTVRPSPGAELPEWLKTTGELISLGSGLIPGASFPRVAARMIGGMAGGALSGGGSGAAAEGLLQGGGELLAAGAPPLGLLLGSASSGGGVGKPAREAIAAFGRERARAAGPLRGLHNKPSAVPVRGTRIPARKVQAGKDIESFESGIGTGVPIKQFGAGEAVNKAKSQAVGVEDEEKFIGGAAGRVSDLVVKKAAAAHGMKVDDLMSLLTSQRPQARQLGQMLVDTATMSVRGAGKLHRNLETEGRKLLEGFRAPPGERTPFSPQVQAHANQGLDIAKDIKTAKEGVLSPAELKGLKALEQRFSDLAKMQSFSNKLWGGGGFFTPGGIGAAGVKGGVASGLARAAIGGTTGFGFGMDPASAALLFAAATPANLARAGNVIGDVGELGPTIMRGVKMYKGEDDDEKTRRRTPGGR